MYPTVLYAGVLRHLRLFYQGRQTLLEIFTRGHCTLVVDVSGAYVGECIDSRHLFAEDGRASLVFYFFVFHTFSGYYLWKLVYYGYFCSTAVVLLGGEGSIKNGSRQNMAVVDNDFDYRRWFGNLWYIG